MNLAEHYNQLYHNAAKLILAEEYALDLEIKNRLDNRFGLTLIIRPDQKIKAEIQAFLNELKKVESSQYYYPDSDIHITVLGIISCYEGFTLDQINVEDYITVINQSLTDLGKIKIEFRGVTASPSAIMIQGFLPDETLNDLRNILRTNFKNSDLKLSIDSRYSISAAHSTVMRFQEKLQNPKKLIEIMEEYRDYDFGKFDVEKLELVYNDWYQRENKTIDLCAFHLR